MNAIEFLETTRRMCREYTGCAECPLCGEHYGCELPLLEGKTAQKTVEIVEKWVREHPGRTYKDVFLEKFPHAVLDEHNEPKNVCVEMIFGTSHKPDWCPGAANCIGCWNRPYPEEDS